MLRGIRKKDGGQRITDIQLGESGENQEERTRPAKKRIADTTRGSGGQCQGFGRFAVFKNPGEFQKKE